jgi:hypothetical protein
MRFCLMCHICCVTVWTVPTLDWLKDRNRTSCTHTRAPPGTRIGETCCRVRAETRRFLVSSMIRTQRSSSVILIGKITLTTFPESNLMSALIKFSPSNCGCCGVSASTLSPYYRLRRMLRELRSHIRSTPQLPLEHPELPKNQVKASFNCSGIPRRRQRRQLGLDLLSSHLTYR